MTHKERFHATIERRKVDRPARWLGMPTSDAEPALFDYFGVSSVKELKQYLDDDLYAIDVPFDCPPANHIACAFDFIQKDSDHYGERTLTTPGFFADCTDPAAVNDFPWPDPEECIDPERCREAVAAVPDDYAKMIILWSAHFQDACAAFGMESALMKMLTEPEIFRAVIDRITEFYLKANRIVLEATRGMLDAALIGNDFGSQNSLMVAPRYLREFVFPGTKRLVDQLHDYDLKVIHHSCGSVFDVIPDLIELGVDSIHPIQALAKNMGAGRLAKEFGDQVSFCGGVDAQHLLVSGSPAMVRQEVTRLEQLFPTGLIISPSHEAILSDIPPKNIAALFGKLGQ